MREQLLNPEYWVRSFDIARKGDYAEDFTGAGLAMQVGLGLIPGVGQAADIRDFIYAVSHTKDNSFWANAGLIGLSLFALIPVVGDIGKGLKGLKYLKHADEAADVLDAVGDVAKHGDELIDLARSADELGEVVEGGLKADFGKKLEYIFGNATGTSHNVERSIAMEKQLNSIGIFDNEAGREIVEDNLSEALNKPTSILKVQDNDRIVRESLLSGPNGAVKIESIWEGAKLITIQIFGGK